MKIDDLDESQGMTREMVDHYLNRNGWCNMPDPDQRLLKPQYAHVSFKMGLGAAIERIAAIVGSTPQALLREINPRMRKGWPSESACAVADRWIAQNTRTKVIIVGSIHYPTGGMELVASLTVRLPQQQSGEWSFWPCDASGNKVRWPVDAEGNML